MTGQAINENSIDDFTQQELQIIADALFQYEELLREHRFIIDTFRKVFSVHLGDVKQVQKKVAGFINS